MKKVLIFTIVLLQTLFVFGQTKTEQYECMFPEDFIFVSKDANGYNITKYFTVEKATLTYEANKLVSFTLKSSDGAQATYTVEQIISEFSHVIQFWIDRSERYFVIISFPFDIDNGMHIRFISNINGSVMFDFLFTRILTEREKKEQQILEEQERAERIKEQERKQQEQIKKEENVKKIFSSVNEVAIESKVTNYFNNKYIEKINDYEGKLDTIKLGYAGKVSVMIGGDSLGVDVIKIEYEDENEKVILDNWIQVAKYYCTLDGIDYYEYQGKIFYLKKVNIKTHLFEYGFGGLKNKGKKFTFYRNVPDLVKKACEQDFRQQGEYFFYYLMIDNEVSIKKLELERKQRDAIRGGKTTGRKILNTIGLIGIGVVALIGAAAG